MQLSSVPISALKHIHLTRQSHAHFKPKICPIHPTLQPQNAPIAILFHHRKHSHFSLQMHLYQSLFHTHLSPHTGPFKTPLQSPNTFVSVLFDHPNTPISSLNRIHFSPYLRTQMHGHFKPKICLL